MLSKFLPRYFLVTLVALVLASGLGLSGLFRVADGVVTILVLPKSVVATAAPGNLTTLLGTAAFVETLKKNNPTVFQTDTDRWLAMPPRVEARLLPEQSIIKITVEHASRAQALALAKATLATLASLTSQYYDVRHEIDIRVIDGPVMGARITAWPLLAMASLVFGLVLTSGFFGGLMAMERLLMKRRALPTGAALYHITPETFRPRVPTPYWSQHHESQLGSWNDTEDERVMDVPTNDNRETIPGDEVLHGHQTMIPAYPSAEAAPSSEDTLEVLSSTETNTEPYYVPELPDVATSPFGDVRDALADTVEQAPARTQIATGPAPDNLPVMEELSPLEGAEARLVATDIDAHARAQAVLPTSDATLAQSLEPTPEEYRRRLNELLSGKL